MFEVGFWEIVIIGIIALIVVGPERLPGVARQVGYWVGRVKSMVASMQTEIRDEVNKIDEVQNLVKRELEIKELHESIDVDLEKPTITTVPQNKREQKDGMPPSQPSTQTDATPELTAKPVPAGRQAAEQDAQSKVSDGATKHS